MKKVSFTTNKSVDVVCKEIEEMIPCVLGTAPNKEKYGVKIVYYPARKFMCTDENMDDVHIIVRKVNNSLTSIKLENSERQKMNETWRAPALIKAYSVLEKVLGQMFN